MRDASLAKSRSGALNGSTGLRRTGGVALNIRRTGVQGIEGGRLASLFFILDLGDSCSILCLDYPIGRSLPACWSGLTLLPNEPELAPKKSHPLF